MAGFVGLGAPSLSEIQAWDVTHLENAARDWTATAQHWETSFTSIHRASVSPGGTVWEGEYRYASLDDALAALETGLAAFIREQFKITLTGRKDDAERAGKQRTRGAHRNGDHR